MQKHLMVHAADCQKLFLFSIHWMWLVSFIVSEEIWGVFFVLHRLIIIGTGGRGVLCSLFLKISVIAGYLTRLSHKVISQGYLTRLSHKVISQRFPSHYSFTCLHLDKEDQLFLRLRAKHALNTYTHIEHVTNSLSCSFLYGEVSVTSNVSFHVGN
jgi:hypothetical protein